VDGDLDIGPGIDATCFVGSVRRESGRSALTRATNGVAVVPVLDTLVNRGAWLDSRSGLTSYDGIGVQIRHAASDPEVHAIVLDISSPQRRVGTSKDGTRPGGRERPTDQESGSLCQSDLWW
jgi:hypothetical protein